MFNINRIRVKYKAVMWSQLCLSAANLYQQFFEATGVFCVSTSLATLFFYFHIPSLVFYFTVWKIKVAQIVFRVKLSEFAFKLEYMYFALKFINNNVPQYFKMIAQEGLLCDFVLINLIYPSKKQYFICREAPENAHITRSLDEAVELLHTPKFADVLETCFVIGGGSIYKV